MKLLHIDSSILGANSVSRDLTAAVVAFEAAAHPGIEIVTRDCASEPLVHLSGALLAAAQGTVPETPAVAEDISASEAALVEFLAADIIVVGAPMYNFGIPSQLKAWIDRITVAGRTFQYGPNGPVGLVTGKRVVIASSRGGMYGPGTAAAFLDHQEAYLQGLFGFLGITDVSVVRAEGVALGPDQRASAIAAAKAGIGALAA